VAEHNTLTGASIHEPKGVAAASVHTVYVADGAGSGAWAKIDADNIDTSSIPGVNRWVQTHPISDLSVTATHYIPVPYAATLVKVATTLDAAIAGADAVLTFTNGVGGSAITDGTVTITQSGSAAGDYDSSTPTVNTTFTADSVLQIDSNGGPSGAAACHLLMVWEWA
jgi:hypothetical protein